MLKYFVLSVFLLALTWQAQGNKIAVPPFNHTDGILIPQPRYAQFSVSDKTYTFSYISVNWYKAVEFCNSQNKVLASVTNGVENKKLTDALHKNGVSQSGFWLGASELGHYGSWTWFNTGRPVVYTNWAAGEPNNGYNKEHCLQLRSDGKWNGVDCNSQHHVVCQNRPICQG